MYIILKWILNFVKEVGFYESVESDIGELFKIFVKLLINDLVELE